MRQRVYLLYHQRRSVPLDTKWRPLTDQLHHEGLTDEGRSLIHSIGEMPTGEKKDRQRRGCALRHDLAWI